MLRGILRYGDHVLAVEAPLVFEFWSLVFFISALGLISSIWQKLANFGVCYMKPRKSILKLSSERLKSAFGLLFNSYFQEI